MDENNLQNTDQPPSEETNSQGSESKKPGLFRRLFGSDKLVTEDSAGKDKDQSKSRPEELYKEKPPRVRDQDWRPIDLSKGVFRDKELVGSRQRFEAGLKKELKKDLGSMLSASQRQKVADTMAKVRSRGLRRGEVRKSLDKLVAQGDLSKFEAKRLRREFKANKSSGIF